MTSKAKTLVRRYNKDHTVSLYHRGRRVFRTTSIWQDTDGFCEGWFGTADKSQWHVRSMLTKQKAAA